MRKAKEVTMQKLETCVLKNYASTFANPTLKTMANDSGINLSRIFRLLNGHSMRVEEMVVFQNRTHQRTGTTLEQIAKIREILEMFPPEWADEIKQEITKKQKLLSFMNMK